MLIMWRLGAVNPRDNDLKITDHGDHLIFDGQKHFNTGGVVSDLTVLEGVLEGTEDHIFAFITTVQDGITFAVRPSLPLPFHPITSNAPKAQLEQRRPPPHRIRQRQNLPSKSPLGQCSRLGHRNAQAQPIHPLHPLRHAPPPHHPARLLKPLPRHRARRLALRHILHQDLDPRLALRRRQQDLRERGVLRAGALRELLRPSPGRRSAGGPRW